MEGSAGAAAPAQLSHKTKSCLTVLGTSLIYFAMGLYFAAGNTAVYLTSYLIYRAGSDMQLDDAIWFLSAAGFSALLLPLGGLLEGALGVRGVCALGGFLQTSGILATYWALDTNFPLVVAVYGGSFLLSLASCYTSPMVNVCKWHPKHRGLVTGIGAASMALAPTLFTPLITALVNPNNLAANERGLFDEPDILERTRRSCLVQGAITGALFLLGVLLTFPAENAPGPSGAHGEPPASGPKGQRKEEPVVLTRFESLAAEARGLASGERQDLGGQREVEEKELEARHGPQPTERAEHQQSRDTQPTSLEPKFALRTLEFWLLSLKVLISELIFIYLLFMYKPYGQTFIRDDYFLSSVGAACAVSNTLGRLTMGHVKDKLGYKAVSIPLSGLCLLFVCLLPLASNLHKLFYGCFVVMAVGAVGSQYALMPSAAQDSFGLAHAPVNIGLVYMSTVIATVSSALLTQNLTSLIGWNGMISLIAGCAALDFGATFLMPSDPARRLAQRCAQFYSAGNSTEGQRDAPADSRTKVSRDDNSYGDHSDKTTTLAIPAA